MVRCDRLRRISLSLADIVLTRKETSQPRSEKRIVDRNAGMGKLTKRFVEAAPARDKAYILWDGDIPGFSVRVIALGPQDVRPAIPHRPALAHHEPRLHASDHAGQGARHGDRAPRRDRGQPRSARPPRRPPRGTHRSRSGSAVRRRAHRRAHQAVDGCRVPQGREESDPAVLRQAPHRRGEPRGGRPLPSQVPACPVLRQPLPRHPLEDVQSRRAVGTAARTAATPAGTSRSTRRSGANGFSPRPNSAASARCWRDEVRSEWRCRRR